MEFLEELKVFAEKIEPRIQSIQNEEATKMSLIVPFFQLLGYDVFNPNEFCPEYTADVGIKKGEKVDYAILNDGKPVVLVECKWRGDTLDKHGSQLFRYFSTTTAKFGILTNGICYKFYTDLDEANKMDLVPFLELNILNMKDAQVNELKKFCKNNFDSERIFSTAEELKYTNLIKQCLSNELESPTDDFVRFILNNVYDGLKTQKTIDKFTPIVKKSFNALINDIVNQKISSALVQDSIEEISEEPEVQSKIITTEQELESFYIIRGMLAGTIPVEDIVHRDTESYFGILYQNNNRKPICRLNLDTKTKYILIPDENKKFERYNIASLNDLLKLRT